MVVQIIDKAMLDSDRAKKPKVRKTVSFEDQLEPEVPEPMETTKNSPKNSTQHMQRQIPTSTETGGRDKNIDEPTTIEHRKEPIESLNISISSDSNVTEDSLFDFSDAGSLNDRIQTLEETFKVRSKSQDTSYSVDLSTGYEDPDSIMPAELSSDDLRSASVVNLENLEKNRPVTIDVLTHAKKVLSESSEGTEDCVSTAESSQSLAFNDIVYSEDDSKVHKSLQKAAENRTSMIVGLPESISDQSDSEIDFNLEPSAKEIKVEETLQNESFASDTDKSPELSIRQKSNVSPKLHSTPSAKKKPAKSPPKPPPKSSPKIPQTLKAETGRISREKTAFPAQPTDLTQSKNAEKLNDRNTSESNNSQKRVKSPLQPPSKSKSEVKSSAKPPEVGKKESITKHNQGEKTNIRNSTKTRKTSPFDQVEEKFKTVPNQKYDIGKVAALRCNSLISEVSDQCQVLENDGPYSPELRETSSTTQSSKDINRGSSPANSSETKTEIYEVDPGEFEEPNKPSTVLFVGSKEPALSEGGSLSQEQECRSSSSGTSETSSISTENSLKEVEKPKKDQLTKSKVVSEIEGNPAEILSSTDDEKSLIAQNKRGLEIVNLENNSIEQVDLDLVATPPESQSDRIDCNNLNHEEHDDTSKQIYLDSISLDDTSLSDIEIETLQALTPKNSDVSSDSESEGSSEEFTMDEFTLVQSDSSESDYEQETVLYEMPSRLRRITELTEATEHSNRSSFRSVIEEEPQVAKSYSIELDSKEHDAESIVRETLDDIIGNALTGVIEDKHDEGFVSSTDMLGSDDRLDQFDDEIFCPITVPEIDHENRVVLTIPDLCLFKSQYNKNVDQQNQMKKDERFAKIDTKADYSIWQNEEKLESFITSLESDEATENDILLPLEFIAQNRQKGTLFIKSYWNCIDTRIINFTILNMLVEYLG